MKTTVALLAAMIASASAFAPAAVGLPKSMALRKPATTSLKMSFEIVDGTPFKLNIAPIGAFGFAGWVVPTILVPSNIPLYGGKVYISCSLPVLDNLRKIVCDATNFFLRTIQDLGHVPILRARLAVLWVFCLDHWCRQRFFRGLLRGKEDVIRIFSSCWEGTGTPWIICFSVQLSCV